MDTILAKHAELFKDELGLVKGVKVKLHVNPAVKSRFFKPRAVPYALKQKVEAELDRLCKAKVIEPIQFSDWAAPTVPVVKADGNIQICGDYKFTVNTATSVESYPLPRIEDLLASIGKSKVFSKLDLANAYQQLELEDESKNLVTISTQCSLFHYNRLPFGVSSAPAIFQRTMETLLRDISNVVVYLDDVLVSGASEEEHLRTLDQVLERLCLVGLRLKLSKCAFMLPLVEYLGHVISAEGIHPSKEKTKAIMNVPTPQNVTQLKSFLGLLNYYGKFLPHLATTLAPLYSLLQKHRTWNWGKQQDRAFKEAKHLLSSAEVLTHFDPVRSWYWHVTLPLMELQLYCPTDCQMVQTAQ